MGRSILEDLGEEVTGIAAPVSICMILTITLVRLLNPDGDGDSGAVYLASIYYTEEVRGSNNVDIVHQLYGKLTLLGRWLLQEGDSAGKKLSGSVINALIFVGIMTITTFIMVLLFKYGVSRGSILMKFMALHLREPYLVFHPVLSSQHSCSFITIIIIIAVYQDNIWLSRIFWI